MTQSSGHDRDELIEAGARALYPMTGRTDPRHDGDYEHTTAAAVIAAVEPLIRADERADLRAKAEALIDGHCFDFVEWDTGVPKCRHPKHRSGWSATCPKAWAAEHVFALLPEEANDE